MPPNVTVLDGPEPIRVRAGVEVIGAPWMTKRPLRDLVAAACEPLVPDPDCIRILVGHGALDFHGEFHDPSTISLAAAEAAINEGLVQYVALGDRHSTTRASDTGRIWYSGAPEPTAHDETDAGNVLLVDIEGGECTVTPQPIGTWRFVSETIEFDAESGPDALRERLEHLPSKGRSIVRLTELGVLSLTRYTDLQKIVEDAREVFGSIEDGAGSNLLVRPEDDDFADLGLSGFAKNAVDRLRATSTGDGPEAATARDALSLLVRLVLRHESVG